MIRRFDDAATEPVSFAREKRALECGGMTPLFAARVKVSEIQVKVRDRQDELANTRDACVTQNF